MVLNSQNKIEDNFEAYLFKSKDCNPFTSYVEFKVDEDLIDDLLKGCQATFHN